MYRGFHVLYTRIRAACPAAKIGFGYYGEGRSTYSDLDWQSDRFTLAAEMLALVRAKRAGGDANVHFLPGHAHITAETGWDGTVGSTDARTGLRTGLIGDSVHPMGVPRVSAYGTWPCRHHRNRKARSL